MKSIQEIFSLKGKVAIVTGGGKGIGQAIVLRLAEAGAQVVIADIDPAAAAATEALVAQMGGVARVVVDDTSTIDDAAAVVQFAVDTFGRLDILVNNAGIFRFQSFVDLTPEMWDATINTNLKGAAFLSQAAARQMITQGEGGRIINISSIDAYHPTGNLSHYDASKGGLEMLTKSMARELAQHGILVNSIAPGGIATPGAGSMMGAVSDPEALKAMMAGFLATLPLKRMGDPEEIANMALFLASAAGSYCVGSSFIVDGGALIR
ncbi:MAG TPA: glucose 1-dehydrogenase [Bacteroidia bacterium]|nr:glucose 1-dehydrogenase [Bacteroidia bacterium]